MESHASIRLRICCATDGSELRVNPRAGAPNSAPLKPGPQKRKRVKNTRNPTLFRGWASVGALRPTERERRGRKKKGRKLAACNPFLEGPMPLRSLNLKTQFSLP